MFELRPQDLADAHAQAPPSALDTFVRPPNAARLAPLPEERRDTNGVEEIIVLGGNWRLPDLGSRWRARQEAADEAGIAHLTLLPLYDPERPTHVQQHVPAEQRSRANRLHRPVPAAFRQARETRRRIARRRPAAVDRYHDGT